MLGLPRRPAMGYRYAVEAMLLSLVIPTLDEAGSVPALFSALERAVRAFPSGTTMEAVVVDDGSTDGTVAAVRSLAPGFPVRLVERSERGLATAVLAGFAAAHGDVLGVIDADLSHPPELLPALLAALEGADIAVASRHAPGGRVEDWPWYRRYASLMMTGLTAPLRLPVADPLSGYFLLRRETIDGVRLSPLGYKILLEILAKGRYRKVREVPYVFRNRGVGKSKMGLGVTLEYLRHLGRIYACRASRATGAVRSLDTDGRGH